MARVVVVGAGISGLSFAWFLKNQRPGWEVLVLEADGRAGGKAWTVREEGFLCERGVNGFLDNKPSTVSLARAIGLETLRSNDEARRRFVVKSGRLATLPDGPGAFLSSPLLSLSGRLRVLLETVIPKGDMDRDESLAAFARRRLGKEAFRYLIDPMASGIYAGDPERLSLASCFPRIHELEQDYGSLIRAMIHLGKEAKRKGKKGPGAGPGGTLHSFAGGMEEIVKALCAALGPALRVNARVCSASRSGGRWEVGLKSGETVEATHVVIAAPARQSGVILREAAPKVTEIASRIPYPPVSVVCFGMKEASVGRRLDGFGFLAPRCEGRKILGCLWDSSIFSGRAPAGYVLLRTLVGGARAPELARLKDESLTELVMEELSSLLGIEKSPEFVRIFRWEEAIPQYEVGYRDLMRGLVDALHQLPGLAVCCNWVGGVSFNDCVANAERLAGEIAEGGR